MRNALLILVLMAVWTGCSPTAEDQSSADSAPSASSEDAHGHADGHRHEGHANRYMNQSEFEELVARFDDPSRVEWQRPDAVLDLLGDLQGKVVMDLGAGSGYFSFPLNERGAQVIAADVDQRFLDLIQEKRKGKGISAKELGVRKVDYGDPHLKNEEIDLFFTVNTYHHLENRTAYFPKVMAGLKPGGRVVVVDFKHAETPHGPPVEMRIPSEEIVNELEDAGFEVVRIDADLLPEQFVVIAEKGQG